MPAAYRKKVVELIKTHIIKDLEEEKYVDLFIDVMCLMHAKAVNLNFIKCTPKFESQN